MPTSLVVKEFIICSVRPTGGSMQWTATVCEFLSDYLNGAQVKIIVQVCNQNQRYLQNFFQVVCYFNFSLNIFSVQKSPEWSLLRLLFAAGEKMLFLFSAFILLFTGASEQFGYLVWKEHSLRYI